MMTKPRDNVKLVCYACIGDKILSDDVKNQDARGYCSYCGEMWQTVTLDNLAKRVRETLHEHFQLTLGYADPDDIFEYILEKQGIWERKGDPISDVIANMAGLTKEVTDDILKILSSSWQVYRLVKEGGVHPYDYEAFYEEREPEEWMFREAWDVFCTEIRSHARFFSLNAKEILDSIFGDMADHKTYDNSPVIRVIGPEDTDRFVWRARKALSKEELKTILESPDREIGPPPSEFAEAGRMNARGIPVFYGAMEASTCVSEIRPPVGSYVIVGKFELLRPIRLLELDTLARIYVQGSYFAPNYAWQKARVAFLGHLVSEISRPVMPQDEEREYLPTQVVAEYLAGRASPLLDGIIFPSSQTNGDGRNIVLFNHACGVEPHERPQGVSVDVDLSGIFSEEEDWRDNEITIFETTQDNINDMDALSETKDTFSNFGSIRIELEEEDALTSDPSLSYAESTLRLDLESICVQYIKGVQYEHEDYTVYRIKFPDDSFAVEVEL